MQNNFNIVDKYAIQIFKLKKKMKINQMVVNLSV